MQSKWAWMATVGLAASLASGPALAKTHRCVDAKGRVEYSGQPCPVIAAPPPPPAPPLPCPLTVEERRTAERREMQFLQRYPDEARHRAATLSDLQEVIVHLRSAQRRLDDLKRERKAIDEEIEFHPGKPLPPDLARRLSESEARFAATADVLRGQENEIKTVMARFECERLLFGMLWHDGAPGSSACAAACKAGA